MPRNRRCKMQHFSKVIKSEKCKVENMTKNELNDCHEMKADENKDPSVSSDDADADDADVDVDGFDDDYDGKFKDQAVNDVIGLVLEIQEPLYNLKRELERETGLDLSEHQLFLQDSQPLSLEMTLVDQCLQGEGLVQINLEIKVDKGIKKINIVDVIQPSDDAIARAKMRDKRCHDHSSSKAKKKKKKKRALPNETDDREQETWKQQDTVTKWVVSKAFRDQMETLQIPTDPTLWHRMHVKHWAEWVVNEFPDTHFDPNSSEWDLDGKELCNMSHDEFKKKVVDDPGDLMWTHLELLRNVKFVAVVQRKKDGTIMSNPDFQKYSIGPSNTLGGSSSSSLRKTNTKPPVRLGKAKCTVLTESSSPHGGNRSGNNGQVQLWQFLLELLTDKEHRNVIHWIGDSGEFKLENPETVAQLWGTRKNKPNMNYEKLSRALRYYYDGDMISKVHGKRFVYKFVCNLKNLIGYTASELNNLVIEAEQRSLGSISVFN